MQQDINLYNYLPQKTGFNLEQKTILSSYAGFLLLLFMFYFISLWQRHDLNTQLIELTNETSLQQQELAVLQQEYPVNNYNDLKTAILQLQKKYEAESYLIDLLSPYAHFSAYLTALGNAKISGIWLTRITFARGGNKIALHGFTLRPSLLAHFITQLSMQPIFSDLVFEINDINEKNYPASFYIIAKKANKL